MHLTLAIATWNRASLLAETLASLAMLRIPEAVTWDILVCDNNSTDHTKQVVDDAKTAATQLPLDKAHALPYVGPRRAELTYLFEPTQGKSHALNRILREARGEWVLFLDDDVIVDANWLAAYVDAIAKHPKAAVLGGAVLPRLYKPATPKQSFLIEHYPGAFGILNVPRETPIGDPQPTPGGANMAVKRDIALELGFDTTRGMFPGGRIAGEDMMMALRIIRQGHEGWLLPDAKVLHHTPENDLTSRRLFRWQAGIGRMWAAERGRPTPGKFGIAWWAWRELFRRWRRMIIRWRPWPSRSYYDALVEVAQYRGYLRAK